MTLEDFFTLTEMKDGLTVPARVEELVAVMKKEKDSVMKNSSDATRQWSTVASVIAVTDNKDCLDLFIQLDGLWFIERWLKDAQTISADASDCFVEESISALLQALEKLKIDNEKLTSSGICVTVKDLLSHKSNNIQDKAKALLGNLKPSIVSGAVELDSEEVEPVCDGRTESGDGLAGESGTLICSAANTPDRKADIDQNVHQCVGDDAASTGCCGDSQSEGVESAANEPDRCASHYLESNDKEVEDKFEFSVREVACPSKGKAACQSPDLEQGTEVRKEGKRPECFSEVMNAEIKSETLPDKLGKLDGSPPPAMSKPVEVSSNLDKDDVLESDRKTVLCTENHVNSSTMKNMPADEHQQTGRTNTLADDDGVLKNCTVRLEHKTSGQGDESCSKTLQDSPADGSVLGRPDDLTYPQNDNAISVDKVGECAKHDSSCFGNSLKLSRGNKSGNVTSKTSAMELEYGTVDALEVACLVAKEVERQVEEDEQFGGFPEKSLHLADGADTFNVKEDQQTEGDPLNESLIVEKMSVEGSPKEDKPLTNSDNVDVEQENGMKDEESSQVDEAVPESAINADKGAAGIDLNLDICSDDVNDAANSVSNPVSVISASRTVAASGLHASAFPVEGSLGWKGSAAVGAPASSHRSSDGDKTILAEKATTVTRQRQDLVIDLNIAEESDDRIMNPLSCKLNPVLPGLPSGEALIELSSRRLEKISFDLNQMSEDGDVPPLDQKSFSLRTAHCSQSPASSSSSLKPATRNFDLNDGPSNFSDQSDLQPYFGISSAHKVNTYGGSSDDSFISIMGAKVKKNTFLPQTPHSLFNGGRASERVSDANLARAGPVLAAGSAVQYKPPPVYSYNSIAVNPTMSFSSPMYGPGGSVAYMVDSRGVSLVPQLLGSPPTVHAPFAHQPSFTTNMAGPLPGPNGIGSSRPSLDLNSGFVVEGVNGDPGGFRQFLVPGQVRSAEEHLQPLFPGVVGGKRKQPDGGWEPYMTNYKHHPPPHL